MRSFHFCVKLLIFRQIHSEISLYKKSDNFHFVLNSSGRSSFVATKTGKAIAMKKTN